MRLIDADLAVLKENEDFSQLIQVEKNASALYLANIIHTGIISYLSSRPTVEAELVKHGTWELSLENKIAAYQFCCSECSSEFAVAELPFDFHYCPNCGARMDGGKKQ